MLIVHVIVTVEQKGFQFTIEHDAIETSVSSYNNIIL